MRMQWVIGRFLPVGLKQVICMLLEITNIVSSTRMVQCDSHSVEMSPFKTVFNSPVRASIEMFLVL